MGYLGHSSGTPGAIYCRYQRAQREYSVTERVLKGYRGAGFGSLAIFGFVCGLSIRVHLCISAPVHALVCATGLCIARRRRNAHAQTNAGARRPTRTHAHMKKSCTRAGTDTHAQHMCGVNGSGPTQTRTPPPTPSPTWPTAPCVTATPVRVVALRSVRACEVEKTTVAVGANVPRTDGMPVRKVMIGSSHACAHRMCTRDFE